MFKEEGKIIGSLLCNKRGNARIFGKENQCIPFLIHKQLYFMALFQFIEIPKQLCYTGKLAPV